MRVFLMVLALLLAGANTALAGELSGTLKRINDSGQINVGFRTAEPPMSFVDPSDKPIGYSIDVCDHIATAVKRKLGRDDIAVNYLPVTAESRFSAIESGSIDILCGATTKTLARSERVDFTQLTFVTGASLLSLDSSPIADVESLKAKRIAVVDKTTTIDALKGALSERLIDAEIVPVNSAMEGMDALDKGEVDAFSSDQVVLIGQALARKTDKKYFLSQEMFSFEPFALAVARDDADFRLVADRALSQLYRSGQIAGIYNRWFGRFAKKPPVALKALYQLHSTPE
jgi:glutamate/aspartate transport system substrate-binding protein